MITSILTWHPVSECLPSDSHDVLVLAWDLDISIRHLKGDQWYPNGLPIVNSLAWTEVPPREDFEELIAPFREASLAQHKERIAHYKRGLRDLKSFHFSKEAV